MIGRRPMEAQHRDLVIPKPSTRGAHVSNASTHVIVRAMTSSSPWDKSASAPELLSPWHQPDAALNPVSNVSQPPLLPENKTNKGS